MEATKHLGVILLVGLTAADMALGKEHSPLGSAAPKSGLDDDPVLNDLVGQALERRPEIARARTLIHAERARASQAGALPDPTLSAGIQNDGFDRLQIGEMETSYYSLMLSQAIPFPGKRGLRRDIAALGAEGREAGLSRALLSTAADVRRAYVDLLLARDELALLGRLESLWDQAERVTKARYEVGQGSQADLLRAQLERTRLRQRRWALEANERTAAQTLNRLRGSPLDEPIDSSRHLEEISPPEAPALEAALRDAEARSPELAAARLAVVAGERQVTLARRELWPDFSIGAGVMPRGDLPPMWQVTLGVSLPVYAGSKQLPAIDETNARLAAERDNEETVLQLLRLRTSERLTLLAAVLKSNELYRGGLLVQSDAVAASAMGQYQVGNVPFTAVLEALEGFFNDRVGYLASIARALRLTIAQQELLLEAPAVLAVGGGSGAAMGGASASMSGAGGMAGAPTGTTADAAAPAARSGRGMAGM